MNKIENLLKRFEALHMLYTLSGYSDEEVRIASSFSISDGQSPKDDERAHHFSVILSWLITDLKTELNEMALSSEIVDIQQLCEFLVRNETITTQVFRPLLRMMARDVYSTSGYIEPVLSTKAMEDKLICPASLVNSEEVEALLRTILLNKVMDSCVGASYSWNYKIFLEWFPKFWGIYPEIKKMITFELISMEEEGELSLKVAEERKLYDFYTNK